MEPSAQDCDFDAAVPAGGTGSDDSGGKAPSGAGFSRRNLLRGLGGAAAAGSALAVTQGALRPGRADAAATLVSKQGTVTAVDYTKRTASVLINGTVSPATGIPYVGATPSVGDKVNLLQQGTTTYVVGSTLSTNPASVQKNVVDIVSDYGADPTGKTDDSGRFAQANSELAAAGGGLIQLRPSCLHVASFSLSPKVSLAGHGFYSRLQGVPAATGPIITVTSVDGNQIRDLQIVGTRPQGTLGSTANPEIGISLLRGTQAYPLEGLIDNVLIFNTKGDGLRVGPYVLGMMLRGLRTFWTGGRGINVDPTATDGYASDCDVGACVGGDAGIYAGGMQWQWSNCQSYAQGQLISAGVPAWDPNGTAAGWIVGFLQTIYGCHSEDNPVGWKIQGGTSRVRGTSGGDREPVVISSLGPTYADNDIDVQVFCQDRFVPRNGCELPASQRNKVRINVNWDSVSAGPHAEAGAIKDQPGFQVFKDQSAGFGSIYNSEYHCNGEDAWVFWQASAGPLTPDLKNGLKYYVVLDTNLTINSLVHRGGVPGGQRVSFTFDPGGSGARRVVTWAPSYNDAPQPILTPGRRTTVEFVQEDLTFTGVTLRRIEMTQPPATHQLVKRTSGSYAFSEPSSTTWYDVDPSLDLTLNASPGDVVAVGINGSWNNEPVAAALDVCSVVGGNPVNYWGGSGGGGDNGIPAWQGPPAATSPIGAPMPRKVVAADLSNGQLTVRLRVRVGTPLLSKTLLATSASPLTFSVENKGQQIA